MCMYAVSIFLLHATYCDNNIVQCGIRARQLRTCNSAVLRHTSIFHGVTQIRKVSAVLPEIYLHQLYKIINNCWV